MTISFSAKEVAAIVLSNAAINAGLAKMFDLSKPSAIGMYSIGFSVSQIALGAISDNPATILPGLVLSHYVGKALAKETTGVDVTFADQIQLVGAGLIASLPFLVQGVIIFPKAYEVVAAQNFARSNTTNW